jgi:hypothetical protein
MADPLVPLWSIPDCELRLGEEAIESEINSNALKVQCSFTVPCNPQRAREKHPDFSAQDHPAAPAFDIAHQRYAEAMRAQETPEQREARELSALAITNPAAYLTKLKARGAYSQPPVSQNTPSNRK